MKKIYKGWSTKEIGDIFNAASDDGKSYPDDVIKTCVVSSFRSARVKHPRKSRNILAPNIPQKSTSHVLPCSSYHLYHQKYTMNETAQDNR